MPGVTDNTQFPEKFNSSLFKVLITQRVSQWKHLNIFHSFWRHLCFITTSEGSLQKKISIRHYIDIRIFYILSVLAQKFKVLVGLDFNYTFVIMPDTKNRVQLHLFTQRQTLQSWAHFFQPKSQRTNLIPLSGAHPHENTCMLSCWESSDICSRSDSPRKTCARSDTPRLSQATRSTVGFDYFREWEVMSLSWTESSAPQVSDSIQRMFLICAHTHTLTHSHTHTHTELY